MLRLKTRHQKLNSYWVRNSLGDNSIHTTNREKPDRL